MIQVRKAQSCDLAGILDLWEDFTQHLNHLEPDFFQLKADARHIYQEQLVSYLEQQDVLVLVAEESEELIGYHICSIRYPGQVFIQEPFGQISDLYLKDGYRGQEIGEQMIQQSLDWLGEKDVKKVKVKTFCVNPGGIAFWEKNGFQAYETVFKYVD